MSDDDVPYVAVGADQFDNPPWGSDLNCPLCGNGPLPLEDSTGDGSIVLSYIHCDPCNTSFMRGPIRRRG